MFSRFLAFGALIALPLAAGCTTNAASVAAPVAKTEAVAETAETTLVANSLVAEQDDEIGGDAPPEAFAGQRPPSAALTALEAGSRAKPVAPRSAELDALIARYAAHYQVPERLVRRVVKRESNFDPSARNRIYWGLMQIRHDTARTMGYRGTAAGLLDAETNLKYAVKYLRGAYLTAGGNEDQAVRFYARGYYYDAKRKGILRETGLRD
ncbi:lytic transglycosylase domain-containing protein [Nitratireductor soli]|uniref:lytic transglycosylase domain-containing protein n=1 Tax=Nitratireductor soli TaxID=1670619 RepID=UPI00069CEAAB|nr:lytic transglycosylase domain-containing protein [Nitratireductor soli]